jgi:predicted lipoprotein with Yx(FWY)xxD motif
MSPKKIVIPAALAMAFLAGCANTQPLKNDNGVMADANGRTVYMFDKDMANSGKSVCNGPCAALWPAVPAGSATPSAPYSVVMRDDGSKQLAYNGKPLYLYSADRKPGDRNGDNFKGIWHVVKQ